MELKCTVCQKILTDKIGPCTICLKISKEKIEKLLAQIEEIQEKQKALHSIDQKTNTIIRAVIELEIGLASAVQRYHDVIE